MLCNLCYTVMQYTRLSFAPWFTVAGLSFNWWSFCCKALSAIAAKESSNSSTTYNAYECLLEKKPPRGAAESIAIYDVFPPDNIVSATFRFEVNFFSLLKGSEILKNGKKSGLVWTGKISTNHVQPHVIDDSDLNWSVQNLPAIIKKKMHTGV